MHIHPDKYLFRFSNPLVLCCYSLSSIMCPLCIILVAFFFISPRASFIIFKIFQNFALAKEYYNQIAENSEWSYENCDENCMDIASAFSSLSTTSLRYNLFTSKINKNINIRVPLAVKLILFISLQENLWKRSPWIFCFYFVLFLSGITPISYL